MIKKFGKYDRDLGCEIEEGLGIHAKSGGGSSTTVQKADPWTGQQPYLTDTFQKAQNLYNSPGAQYYPNATYTPFSPHSSLAYDLISNRALHGSGANAALDKYVTSGVGTDPYSPGAGYNALNQVVGQGITDTSAAQNYATSTLNGLNPSFTRSADDVMSKAGGGIPGTVNQYLEGNIRGDLVNNNPYAQSMYRNAAQQVTDSFNDATMPSINATFSSAGRTGGGLHQKAIEGAQDRLGDDLTRMAADIYGKEYGRERTLQHDSASTLGNLSANKNAQDLQAAGIAANLYGQDMGNKQQAANILGNLNATDVSGKIGATSGLTNLYGKGLDNQYRAASLAPQAAEAPYKDYQALLGVGKEVEGQSQRILDDARNRYNFYQTQPEERLANYIAAIQGNYGGSTSTKQSEQLSDMQQLGQGVSTAASIASLFAMFSDENLKKNISPIGAIGPFTKYEWEWNDQAHALGLEGKSKGVIAQEVERVFPQLVGEKDGYKTVDYMGLHEEVVV